MDAMQIQQFLQAVQNLMAQGAAVGGGAERKDRRGRVVVEKGYNRLSKFSHGESEWVEWAYDFKTILGTQCHQMKDLCWRPLWNKSQSSAQQDYTRSMKRR